jgi:two-component system sensor histidine kinase VicK
LEAIPEIKDQPIYEILQDVYNNNKTFEGHGLKVPLASSTDGPLKTGILILFINPDIILPAL